MTQTATAENRRWVGTITDDPARKAIILTAGQLGFRPRYLRSLSAGMTDMWQAETEMEQPPHDAQVVIPEDLAHLLWELLNQHYGGPGPSRELRKDYEAERKRVDVLIEAVVNPRQTVTLDERRPGR